MEDDDIVRTESLSSVRAITHRTAVRVIVVSVLVGALGGGLLSSWSMPLPGQVSYGSLMQALPYSLALGCTKQWVGTGTTEALGGNSMFSKIEFVAERLFMGRKYGSTLTASGLTIRSSRTCFVTPTTWQEKLAMLLAPLRKSA